MTKQVPARRQGNTETSNAVNLVWQTHSSTESSSSKTSSPLFSIGSIGAKALQVTPRDRSYLRQGGFLPARHPITGRGTCATGRSQQHPGQGRREAGLVAIRKTARAPEEAQLIPTLTHPPFSCLSVIYPSSLLSASTAATMELRHWHRDDSASSESGDSSDGMHDENCAGCLRIVKEEEERLRSWQENEPVVEGGIDLEGEHETLVLHPGLIRREYMLSPYKRMLRAVVSFDPWTAVPRWEDVVGFIQPDSNPKETAPLPRDPFPPTTPPT